jgi:pimeloyl-ACP methyl ester carboxylesterase
MRAPISAVQPATHGLRSGAVRLATGPRLTYVEQGNLSCEPIVFVHGWPDSWFSYSRILPLLALTDHAYAIDQRGFGDSDFPHLAPTIDDYAADVVAFLDAVGERRATLVGHSMGSFVVRRVAELWPERVARLVLIGSAVTALNDVTREVQAAVRELSDPIPLEFVREFQASTLAVPVPEPFFDGLVSESLKASADVWRGAFDGLLAFDDTADLGRIVAPTLVIWGKHDGLFAGCAGQQQLISALPHARLLVYPDAGHSPNWEWPERLADDLDAFLRRTPPSR